MHPFVEVLCQTGTIPKLLLSVHFKDACNTDLLAQTQVCLGCGKAGLQRLPLNACSAVWPNFSADHMQDVTKTCREHTYHPPKLGPTLDTGLFGQEQRCMTLTICRPSVQALHQHL